MGPKFKKVLIIDNYPLMVQVYKTVLRKIELIHALSFKIEEAKSYEEGLALVSRMETRAQKIDLVFLDLHISISQRDAYTEGQAIGLKIRKRFPRSKILVMADFKNNYQINTILRSIKPEGFLIMADVDMEVLTLAINDVLNDPPYYSRSVLKSFYKSKGHTILLDVWDERLLYELSRGIKMKDLPGFLPFSLATIEKRKKNIKSRFGIEGSDDNMLLEKAREYGFI